MKKLLMRAVLAGAAAMAVTSAADAAITVSQSAYYSYAADVAAFSSANVVCDFDSACASGFNMTFSGGAGTGAGVYTGSIQDITAAPPGDATAYASLLGPDGKATLTIATPVSNISFFMGSPDTYNSVTFYDAANNNLGSFDGSAFTGPPANGDQSLGERITFNFNGAAVAKVAFGSTQNSFEFDRVGTLAGVPEPTSWALMLTGFGGLGAMLRRARRQPLAVLA
jgi:hypothetical protein